MKVFFIAVFICSSARERKVVFTVFIKDDGHFRLRGCLRLVRHDTFLSRLNSLFSKYSVNHLLGAFLRGTLNC